MRRLTGGHVAMALSLAQLGFFLCYGNARMVVAWIVVAVIVYTFTQNPLFVLGAPIVITTMLYFTHPFREGMKPSESKASKNNASKKTPSTTENTNPEKTIAKTIDGFSGGSRPHSDIDYAATVEGAYDELNNILGGEGIQKLTSDTQHLIKQQMQLAEAMKSMGPMMKTLAPMVEQLKGMMGDEGMSSMMNMAKRVTGNA